MARYVKCAICGEEGWEGSAAGACKSGFYDHTWVSSEPPNTSGPAPGSMTWMADLMEDIFDEIRAVRADGQAEYAHDQSNAFANFERAAADLPDVTREQVLWIFAMKHRDGIASWLGGHQSQREDVRGRIKDLIMYLILLWGMIEEGECQN